MILKQTLINGNRLGHVLRNVLLANRNQSRPVSGGKKGSRRFGSPAVTLRMGLFAALVASS